MTLTWKRTFYKNIDNTEGYKSLLLEGYNYLIIWNKYNCVVGIAKDKLTANKKLSKIEQENPSQVCFIRSVNLHIRVLKTKKSWKDSMKSIIKRHLSC